MKNIQLVDINTQILKLRAALPIWGLEADDLVERARNAERAASQVDERTLQRVRGLIETTTGWHDTLLFWEEQDTPPALSADIRVLRATLDAIRTEVAAATAKFTSPLSLKNFVPRRQARQLSHPKLDVHFYELFTSFSCVATPR
jgi:hypothetical protein